MIHVASMLAVAVTLAATGGLAAAALRLEGIGLVLGAYAIAWSECVLIAEVLSPAHAIGLPAVTLLGAVALLAAWAAWRRSGSPSLALPRLGPVSLRRHPVLAVLACAVLAGLAYEAFVAFATAPDNTDALTYHLPRAVEWLNRGSIGYFPASTARENAFPGNAEIGVLVTMLFTRSDTFASLPQYAAQIAIMVGVLGCALRLGYGRASALFAALLTATLTEISLQAVTAQNDLVVASFVCAAVYFILGGAAAEWLPAGLSIGLAIGTKLTAVLALPIVVLLAARIVPPRRLGRLLAATAVGFALVGSWSYGDNLARSGHPLGDNPDNRPFTPVVTATGTISTVARLYDRFVDFGGVPVSASVADEVATTAHGAFAALGIPWNAAGSTFRNYSFSFLPGLEPNEDTSWFGLLGFLLVIPLSLGFAFHWSRRAATPPAARILALALPLFAIALALANSYNPWLGRFMTLPVVLTMPLAAWLYERRLRLGVAGYAAVGVWALASAQSQNVAKPTGLTAGTAPIWSMSRIEQETYWMPGLANATLTLDRLLPHGARLGVVVGGSATYPLYGPHLDRTLTALPNEQTLVAADRAGITWVLAQRTTFRSLPPGWSVRPLAYDLALAAHEAPQHI